MQVQVYELAEMFHGVAQEVQSLLAQLVVVDRDRDRDNKHGNKHGDKYRG